jgi:hypothetical protein
MVIIWDSTPPPSLCYNDFIMNDITLPRTVQDQSPIEALRAATKWVVGPVAETLTGRAWKKLRRRLLTRASQLPHARHLDTALLAEVVAELGQLTWEVRRLLEAHKLEPDAGLLPGIRRRAGKLAGYLLRIYRLEAGQAPQLAALAAGRLSIFVSYSREDWTEFVEPLVGRLRQAGFQVWVDQHLLRGGQDWLDEINRALARSDCLVLCVSPDALDSKYVKMEYRYFVTENKPLIPVICRQAELPVELRGIQHIEYVKLDNLVTRLGEL